MQVLLNTDNHTESSPGMAEHLSAVAHDALDRFGESLIRVDGHLSNLAGHATHRLARMQCMLEARLVGLPAVVVTEQAETAHQAIALAMHTLQQSVEAALARQHGRRHREPLGEAASELASGDPD